MYSLAACNEAGERRLQSMMDEFDMDDLEALSEFIMSASRKATLEAISKVLMAVTPMTCRSMATTFPFT